MLGTIGVISSLDVQSIPPVFLYNRGDENTGLTGGWVRNTSIGGVGNFEPYNNEGVTFIKLSTYMDIRWLPDSGYSGHRNYFTAAKHIDITDYNYLTINVTKNSSIKNSKYENFQLFCGNNRETFVAQIIEGATIGSSYTIQLDISALTGSQLLGISLYYTGINVAEVILSAESIL